jgi:hypothetical protein
MTDELSFMDVDPDDAQELAIAEDGTEQAIAITDIQTNEEKSYVLVYLHMHDLEMHKRIRHFLFYPKGDDDEEKKNNKLLGIKKFFLAFNIEGEDRRIPSAWEGRTAKCVVGVESDQDQIAKYGESNFIKSFEVPRD